MAIGKDEGVEFSIHIIGDTTGKTWDGQFRAKERLSFRDQLNMDRMRRDLRGMNPHEADAGALAIATMIAELSVRITEAPEFWKESRGGMDLADGNLLMEVFNKSREIEKRALDDIIKLGEQAKQDLLDHKKK